MNRAFTPSPCKGEGRDGGLSATARLLSTPSPTLPLAGGGSGLRRHRLAYLHPSAWREITRRGWDPVARECLSHWTDRGLPLVVTRQSSADGGIALGVSAPMIWERRRLSLRAPRNAIERLDDFPLAHAALANLPPASRAALERLLPSLDSIGVQARIYGSHGWQLLTNLPYLHPLSDLDLWIGVGDAACADAVATALCASPSRPDEPRLDGELVWPDGRAVAWREWAAWRSTGMRGPVLAKRFDAVALEEAAAFGASAAASA